MPFMEWDASFELGVTEFDEHHKYLVYLLNLTFDGVTFGASHDELGAVIDELIKYTTYHFAAEEQWMTIHKYPGQSEHRKEHEKFCTRVAEIQKDFHQGNMNLGLEVVQFLNNWLSDHILKTDAQYGRFAKNHL